MQPGAALFRPRVCLGELGDLSAAAPGWRGGSRACCWGCADRSGVRRGCAVANMAGWRSLAGLGLQTGARMWGHVRRAGGAAAQGRSVAHGPLRRGPWGHGRMRGSSVAGGSSAKGFSFHRIEGLRARTSLLLCRPRAYRVGAGVHQCVLSRGMVQGECHLRACGWSAGSERINPLLGTARSASVSHM